MKHLIAAAALLAFAALPRAARAEAACSCCTGSAKPAATTTATVASASGTDATATTSAPAGHPLRGVVVEILADKQALLVKHEEIPGVMKAMTMLLKVDAAVLSSVKKGQAITATLLDKDDGWWLADVKSVEAGQVGGAAK